MGFPKENVFVVYARYAICFWIVCDHCYLSTQNFSSQSSLKKKKTAKRFITTHKHSTKDTMSSEAKIQKEQFATILMELTMQYANITDAHTFLLIETESTRR